MEGRLRGLPCRAKCGFSRHARRTGRGRLICAALLIGVACVHSLVTACSAHAATSLDATPAGAAPASDWAVVDSPNITTSPYNFPSSVTCASSSDCWAVGHFSDGSADQTLVEEWNGNAWAVVTSPNTSPAKNNYLYGATCVSTSDCWAVGFSSSGSAEQTLVEQWDGNVWAIVASANATGSVTTLLDGVSCLSATDCWAVGYSSNGGAPQSLIEQWDGTAWMIVSSPNAGTAQTNVLLGVTCVSATDCWGVGYTSAAGGDQTLVQHWNGTSWAVASSPNAGATQDDFLSGVGCVSASDCWTVGYAYAGSVAHSVVERWDGSAWTIHPSPNSTTGSTYLNGVTCVSTSNCWGAGYTSSGGVDQTLVEQWDGTAWSIVTSPDTSATQTNRFTSVTCFSGSGCWAVGYSLDGAVYHTLVELWDGSRWVVAPSPNATATSTLNFLLSVSCVSVSDCWAVGYASSGSADQTLGEHWDGSAWTIVTTPDTGATQTNYLLGVTCVSTSDCWAVGYTSTSSADQTLVEHWDGTAWAIVPSPNTSTALANALLSVSCVSGSDCWAVGYSANTSAFQTLAERWDGSAWVIATSPNAVAAQADFLTGVTCVSTSGCYAVGYSSITGSDDETLMEQWNGSAWAVITSPNAVGAQANYVYGVTCVSESICWAVGYAYNGITEQTLTERWNGSAWSVVTSPNTGVTDGDELNSVTCTSASECWAVGYSTSGGAFQTLIEQWNGSTWAITSSPNAGGSQSDYLFGVICATASDCWAVGYSSIGSADHTLTEVYAAGPPAVVPDVPWAPLLLVVGVAGSTLRVRMRRGGSSMWSRGRRRFCSGFQIRDSALEHRSEIRQ